MPDTKWKPRSLQVFGEPILSNTSEFAITDRPGGVQVTFDNLTLEGSQGGDGPMIWCTANRKVKGEPSYLFHALLWEDGGAPRLTGMVARVRVENGHVGEEAQDMETWTATKPPTPEEEPPGRS